eukprot:TRINITY_DN43026_c0_g1_i1.p3 TRINITY_DN43026_c0_g1~~TRINITY_DN43026_c0_g1_i1.p3  ORF type:complete len:105 (-),score=2.88 TRINITY_DN43026_c0_g1_i1:135-449(-)
MTKKLQENVALKNFQTKSFYRLSMFRCEQYQGVLQARGLKTNQIVKDREWNENVCYTFVRRIVDVNDCLVGADHHGADTNIFEISSSSITDVSTIFLQYFFRNY